MTPPNSMKKMPASLNIAAVFNMDEDILTICFGKMANKNPFKRPIQPKIVMITTQLCSQILCVKTRKVPIIKENIAENKINPSFFKTAANIFW